VKPVVEVKDEMEFAPVKSADRVLTLIELLTEHRDGLTFTQLQELTGWPRSSLYGLLRTMAERHHLEFDPHSQGYRVGVRLWEAGQAFNSGVEIVQVAMPHLREARERLGETVQLAVLDGVENIYIAKVDAKHALKLDSFVGARLPAHATGIGKVLLAGLTDEELDRRLQGIELIRYTATTISDVAALREVLNKIRAQGFATDDQEYTMGVRCYAVPISDVAGQVTAAISVSIPLARVSAGIDEAALSVLTEAAGRISAQLGYRANPEA
jgi:DNA-binding IclR family transcriptional regulator